MANTKAKGWWATIFAGAGMEIVVFATPQLYSNIDKWFLQVLIWLGLGLVLIGLYCLYEFSISKFKNRLLSFFQSFKGIHIKYYGNWLNLSSRSEMVKTRGDTAIYTEPEWRIDGLYFEAKNKSSKVIEKIEGYFESIGTKRRFAVLIDSYKPEDTHGIPSKANFVIAVRFPKSTFDREGWTFEEFWREFGAFKFYFSFDGKRISKTFSQKEIQEYISMYIESLPKRKQGEPRIERKTY